MNKRRLRILFIKRDDANAKFVTNDILILKRHFEVDVDEIHLPKSFAILPTLVKKFFSYAFRIHSYDAVYIWFADYHSFLPVMFSKLFHKKSIICAGGYESTYIPEIEMGVYTSSNFRKKARRYCTTYSLRNCSLILPVDDTLADNTNTYIYSDEPSRPPLKDGIRNMIPGIRTPMKTIKLGYDPAVFRQDENISKGRAVVSAGLMSNSYEFKRKGFNVLAECAKLMPDVKFILIGLNDEYYNKLLSSGQRNLELHKTVTYDELIRLYSSAKVYAQLSLFEGMPSSVCEAMLCNCVPVGSEVNGIPDIIGDTGIIVKKKDIALIAESINEALSLPDSSGERARERIMKLFKISMRESELIAAVSGLFQ